jgi:hypothetical protein
MVTIAPDRWTARGRGGALHNPKCVRVWAVANSHCPEPICEGLPISAIIVADQVDRCRVPRKCFDDLLRQPLCCRVPGHRKPKQLASAMAYYEEYKQTLECHRLDHAEINRR